AVLDVEEALVLHGRLDDAAGREIDVALPAVEPDDRDGDPFGLGPGDDRPEALPVELRERATVEHRDPVADAQARVLGGRVRQREKDLPVFERSLHDDPETAVAAGGLALEPFRLVRV